ncbi:hypothetical protein [Oceanobacter mangrovi]|uniref:hypothetical protein n=1 Tax=Oceanobacter mangrovi TaxID=2862510 RepID=UPI001C8DA5A7|nr:hypothetical protein [Oceanobacter mangrovi]
MTWTTVLVLTIAVFALVALGWFSPIAAIVLKGLLSAAIMAGLALLLFKRQRTIKKQYATYRAHQITNKHTNNKRTQ